jgi:hypothetical protein
VNDAASMRIRERARDPVEPMCDAMLVEYVLALEAVGEIPSLHQLQAQEVRGHVAAAAFDAALPVVEHFTDMRMLQLPRQFRLALEACAISRVSRELG